MKLEDHLLFVLLAACAWHCCHRAKDGQPTSLRTPFRMVRRPPMSEFAKRGGRGTNGDVNFTVLPVGRCCRPAAILSRACVMRGTVQPTTRDLHASRNCPLATLIGNLLLFYNMIRWLWPLPSTEFGRSHEARTGRVEREWRRFRLGGVFRLAIHCALWFRHACAA